MGLKHADEALRIAREIEAPELIAASLERRGALSGDRESWDEARRIFERLGDRAGVQRCLDAPGQTAVPRPREAEFRLADDAWSISFEGSSFRLSDTKGMRYVATLLARPGAEVHALDVEADRPQSETRRTRAEAREAELSASPEAERARQRVAHAIRSALRAIEEHSPALAHHLRATVRTGTLCSYTPDPTHPVAWRL